MRGKSKKMKKPPHKKPFAGRIKSGRSAKGPRAKRKRL